MGSLVVILSLQLALALLVPGVLFHGRTVFFSDLWVFAVVPVFGVLALRPDRGAEESAQDRRWIAMMLGIGLLLALSFFHGRFRTPIADELMRSGVSVQESDQFNGWHELVIVARFLSWILEGALIWRLLEKSSFRARAALRGAVARALLWIGGTAAVLAILSGLSGGFTEWLGGFYGFQGDLPTWRGRAFGSFRTPLETGLTLSLCLLLLGSSIESGKNGTRLRKMSIIGCVFGLPVFLSRTFTAIAALLVTWSATRFAAAGVKLKALFVSVGLVALGILFYAERDLLALKWSDLTYRFTPWRVMFDALIRHPGSLLFGQGFAPINVDNAYLFVLFRLGVVGFVAFAFLAIRWGRTYWRRWTLPQREVLIFLLLTGLTLDTFILRPVVMVFLAAGLPLLYPSSDEIAGRRIA